MLDLIHSSYLDVWGSWMSLDNSLSGVNPGLGLGLIMDVLQSCNDYITDRIKQPFY